MKLSIITINFQKPLVTLSCIASIYQAYSYYFSHNEWELLVVDNASSDNSLEILQKEIKKKQYKRVYVLANKTNNGFGGGNNFGAKRAKGDIFLFINNDTIVGKGIDDMLSFLIDNQHVGIVGGPLSNKNLSKQVSSGKFYSFFRVFLLLFGLQRFGLDSNPNGITKVDWVKGALLMIRQNIFEKLHGFDEKIFMYTEDMELCFRAQKIQEEVWFYPYVEVVHEDQGSSSRAFAVVSIYAGILYFFKKHKSFLEFFLVKLLLQMKALFLILLGRFTKNTYLVTTYEKAFARTR